MLSTGLGTTEFLLFKKFILNSQYKFPLRFKNSFFKDVPTSIPKSDLLHVTTAVIHVAGQRLLVV